MDDLLMEYEGNKPATPTERERRRRLAATVTICGLAFVGIGQLTTGAWFTDQSTANVDFATGTVVMDLSSPDGTNTAGPPKTLTLSDVSNMAPGDTAYRAIHVTNDGSLGIYYAVTGQSAVTSGGDLSKVMDYSVAVAADAASCDASAFGGTLLFGPAHIGTSETPVIGDKAETGNDATNDRKLASGTGGDEWLCVRAALPGNTTVDNAYQDSKTALTLNFYAVQSKHTA